MNLLSVRFWNFILAAKYFLPMLSMIFLTIRFSRIFKILLSLLRLNKIKASPYCSFGLPFIFLIFLPVSEKALVAVLLICCIEFID